MSSLWHGIDSVTGTTVMSYLGPFLRNYSEAIGVC